MNPTEMDPTTLSAMSKVALEFEGSSLNSEIEKKFLRRSKFNRKNKRSSFMDDTASMISSHLKQQYIP